MKKKLVILTLTLAALASAPAAKAEEGFRWGPTLGLDVSSLRFKQSLFEVNKSVGYSAGVWAEMMFPGIGFGLDFGLLYQQNGATLHLEERTMWTDYGFDTSRSYLHYINVPFHLRFKWTRMEGLEDYIAPYVFVGPEFGFLVGHSSIVNPTGSSAYPQGTLSVLEYAGGEVGIGLGFGAELWRRWQVCASYTFGMTYACKMSLLTDDSARNGVWNVRVTYLF